MRLSVHNLGRIRDAELQLRPLTVLYGANNTNKTWLANAAYSSARRLSLEGRLEGFIWPGPGEGKLAPELSRVMSEGRAVLEARDGAEYSYTLSAAQVPAPTDGYVGHAGTLARWLGLPDLLKPDAYSRLHREAGEAALFEQLKVKVKRAGVKLSVAAELQGEAFESFPLETSHRRDELHAALLGPVAWLRDSVYRRAFALTEDRLTQADTLGRPVKGPGQIDAPSPWTAESSRDVQRALGELCSQSPEVRESQGGDEELAQQLSDEVLGGVVEMAPNGTLSFRLGQVRLPLPAAGGGVRALATLSTYLRYLAGPGDLLFLDAPELMLGPDALRALGALLLAMPDRGYRLLVCTGSASLANTLGAHDLAVLYTMDERADGSVLPRPAEAGALS